MEVRESVADEITGDVGVAQRVIAALVLLLMDVAGSTARIVDCPHGTVLDSVHRGRRKLPPCWWPAPEGRQEAIMDPYECTVAAFLAGELDERAAASFDAHLLACAYCWRAVGEDRAGQAAAARLREPAPYALAERVRVAVELAGSRPDNRQRQGRGLEVLAAGALAMAGTVATLIMVVLLSSHPIDPPSISAVVEAARRMPSPTSGPSPGPLAQGQLWTVRAGMAHLRLRYYSLDGVELLVARSDRAVG